MNTMNKLITSLALAGLALSVHAAEPAKAAAPAAKPAATVQATKAAVPPKKVEREPAKAASTRTPSPKQVAQQEKMKACNASAKGKSGDERKAYMKGCLKAKA